VSLTNEDIVRKAKAYILFYVERTGREASDKPAPNKPAVDSGPSDVVMIDVPASHMNTQDVEAPDEAAALDSVGEDVAELHKANVASMDAATESDTSEEAGQAVGAAAQWLCRTASDSDSLRFGFTFITSLIGLEFK